MPIWLPQLYWWPGDPVPDRRRHPKRYRRAARVPEKLALWGEPLRQKLVKQMH